MAGGQVEVQVAKGSERSYNDHPKCDGKELAILKLYVGRIGAPSRDIRRTAMERISLCLKAKATK